MYFTDRADAGKRLAAALFHYHDRPDAIVLALPRGGVPVAYPIAQSLHLPLDLMLVRKLGVPGHEELAMGAIADGHIQVLNEEIVQRMGIPAGIISNVAGREQAELDRRSRMYRHGGPAPALAGRTVILIDDGCATGANMKAAVQAAMAQHAARIVVAVPVASGEACDTLRALADEVVCLSIPEPFYGVGEFYADFSQTSDGEVMALLNKSHLLSPTQKEQEFHG